MTQARNKKGKKSVIFAAGISALILGITLILVWWVDVVIFFKGVLGILLAVFGLFLLYILKD